MPLPPPGWPYFAAATPPYYTGTPPFPFGAVPGTFSTPSPGAPAWPPTLGSPPGRAPAPAAAASSAARGRHDAPDDGSVPPLQYLGQPQHVYVTGTDCASVPAGLSRRPTCSCQSHHGPNYRPGLHATWDCPFRYMQQCGHCPGFRSDGSRDPAQWNGDILTRAAKDAWLALIEKHKLTVPNCKNARVTPFHL